MANDTLIQGTTLTAIADAIRAKDGSTAPMYPSEMAGKIANIQTGNVRIIPTKLIMDTGSNKAKSYSGSGVIFLNTVAPSYVTIDGNSIDLSVTNDSGSYDAEAMFENSCSVKATSAYYALLLGNKSIEKIDGIPKKIIAGLYVPSGGISVSGKGYAKIYQRNASSYYSRLGQVAIDGNIIKSSSSWFGLKDGNSIILNFDKSISLSYVSNTTSNQKQMSYTIYTF